jgi:transposase
VIDSTSYRTIVSYTLIVRRAVLKLKRPRPGLARRFMNRWFGWISRFRRLARDYERLPETVAGLHFVAFVILMLKNVAEVLA